MSDSITNAMRLLKSAGVDFGVAEYEADESDLSGVSAAMKLGEPKERVFKTLVCRGEKTGVNVFALPVAEELDLKKCAAVAGDKRVEMIRERELLPLTGYLRGGCSPVGMKKRYPTFIDETALLWDEIFVSAGRRGLQLRIAPDALAEFTGATICDIIRR